MFFQPARQALTNKQAQMKFVNMGKAVTANVSEIEDNLRLLQGRSAVIAGRIMRHCSKLNVSWERIQEVASLMWSITDVVDISLLLILGWCSVPVSRLVFKLSTKKKEKTTTTKKIADVDEDVKDQHPLSMMYNFALLVSQIAKIACVVYVLDFLLLITHELGLDFPNTTSEKVAKLLYSAWAAFKFMALKRHFLGVIFTTKASNLGKAVSWDRTVDALVLVSLFLTVLDVFHVKVGLGLASALAFGGLGIVVFALASQGLASQVVSGLVLSTAKKVMVGEHIKLGDGIRGIVISMGWLYSEVRNYDESIIQIPNDQLIKQGLTNVSRLTKSQVEQTIRIAYKDLKKIPLLIEDIKNVIQFSCPTLIKDGSRPFRVVWTGYEDDHLTVVVTTHFNLSPLGEEYWNNRQKVLDAVALASEKNHIVFALPQHIVQGGH